MPGWRDRCGATDAVETPGKQLLMLSAKPRTRAKGAVIPSERTAAMAPMPRDVAQRRAGLAFLGFRVDGSGPSSRRPLAAPVLSTRACGCGSIGRAHRRRPLYSLMTLRGEFEEDESQGDCQAGLDDVTQAIRKETGP